MTQEPSESCSTTTPGASDAGNNITSMDDANPSAEVNQVQNQQPVGVESTTSHTIETSAASVPTCGPSTASDTPQVDDSLAKSGINMDVGMNSNAGNKASAADHPHLTAEKSSTSPLKPSLKSTSSRSSGKSPSSNPAPSSGPSSSPSSLTATKATASVAHSSTATRRYTSQGPPPVTQALFSQAQTGYSCLSQSLSSLGSKLPASTSPASGNSTSSGGGNSSIPAASVALDPAVVADRAKEALKSAEMLQQSAKAAFSSFFTLLSPETKPKSVCFGPLRQWCSCKTMLWVHVLIMCFVSSQAESVQRVIGADIACETRN